VGGSGIARRGLKARLLPRARWARALVWLALVAGYVALMWFVVFPWVDRTFVSRPAL
jgi:hypothetical protein